MDGVQQVSRARVQVARAGMGQRGSGACEVMVDARWTQTRRHGVRVDLQIRAGIGAARQHVAVTVGLLVRVSHLGRA